MSGIPDPARWSEAERAAFYARRVSRNRALGVLLFALVALFFGITVVRMADQLAAAPPPSPPASVPAAEPLS
ncbi:hypothetical protein [Sandarakinorhabdus sp.]|uniref:hypothetical protein n=1 Tax=Sandarakinorhabdus sp. TaxID=1916663 RepID=UPI00333F1891